MKKIMQIAKKNRFFIMFASMLSVFALGLTAGAEGTATAPTTDYQSVIAALQGVFTSTTITSVLVYAVGIAIALVFTWWAIRKVTGIVKRAFMRGKLRL